MSYKLDIICKPDYLYVQASGIRSSDNFIPMVNEYIQACDNYRYKKLMLDVRNMPGALSTFNVYNLCKELPIKVEGFRPNKKTAVIDSEGNRERFRFIEDVLINMGFTIRFFNNTANAEQWLSEGK